jgi:hypothetical protein
MDVVRFKNRFSDIKFEIHTSRRDGPYINIR